jgi:hypothetical protein
MKTKDSENLCKNQHEKCWFCKSRSCNGRRGPKWMVVPSPAAVPDVLCVCSSCITSAVSAAVCTLILHPRAPARSKNCGCKSGSSPSVSFVQVAVRAATRCPVGTVGWWCTLVLSAWGLERLCCCRGLLRCDSSGGRCDLSWSVPCLRIDEDATFFDQYDICHSIGFFSGFWKQYSTRVFKYSSIFLQY